MTNPKEVKKEPYQEPKVIDYGNVADLTKQSRQPQRRRRLRLRSGSA